MEAATEVHEERQSPVTLVPALPLRRHPNFCRVRDRNRDASTDKCEELPLERIVSEFPQRGGDGKAGGANGGQQASDQTDE